MTICTRELATIEALSARAGPVLARAVGRPRLAGFDPLAHPPAGEARCIEIKGRAGCTAVRMEPNEWKQACHVGDRHWLHATMEIRHMKLTPPPLAIGPDDGFEKTDLFRYAEFGNRFANIVETLDSATVIVLDGPWGSGKTTFTQQWAGLLRRRGHSVAQFDAFAHDYQDDAFVALAGEVFAHSQHEDTEGFEDQKKKFLKSAASLTKTLPAMAARVGLNLAAQGTLSTALISKFVEAIESANISQLEKRIARAQEGAEAVNNFRECLSNLAVRLAKGSPSAETKLTDGATRKLVFIIDELDRCKPTFALSLLERVKHLFSVDGICFVLVAHLPELARMVEKEYGVTSGQRYLEKFYRLRVTLPGARENDLSRHVRYVNHLFGKMNVRMDDQRQHDLVVEGLHALAGAYELALRTLEQVVGNVALVCLATNQHDFRLPPLIAGLCVMRIVDPELYEKARTGRLGMDEAMRFLRLEEWDVGNVEWHKSAWIYATATKNELSTADIENMEEYNWTAHFRMNRLSMITKTCKQIDDLWQREPE